MGKIFYYLICKKICRVKKRRKFKKKINRNPQLFLKRPSFKTSTNPKI